MIPQERRKATLDYALIYESLLKSINEAGGIPHSVEGLCNMTAFELLCELAPNQIRFRYVTPMENISEPKILDKEPYQFRQGTKSL